MIDPTPCGRPFVIAHEGAIETHCFAKRKDDFLGRVMCKDNTIARLRLELAAAKAASELSTAERAHLEEAAALLRGYIRQDMDAGYFITKAREQWRLKECARMQALRAQEAEPNGQT